MAADELELRYQVVVNDEEQYSIWPAYKQRPLGWSQTGPEGTKAECLAWIEDAWVDMRPRTLREAMSAEACAAGASRSPEVKALAPLAERLCFGEQRIRLARCSDSSDFEAQLKRGYVLFELPDTEGGTELGCSVSSSRSESASKIEVLARVRLDFESLELRAVIDLATLEGVCRITRVPAA